MTVGTVTPPLSAESALHPENPVPSIAPSPTTIRGYHMFRRWGRFFIYDLNQNRFWCVPEVGWDVFCRVSRSGSDADIVGELTAKHGEGAVRAALAEIHEIRRHGFLKDAYVSQMFTDQDIDNLASIDTGGIQINIAQTCNLGCRYCYLHDNSALDGGLMQETTGIAAVDLSFRRATRGRTKLIRIVFFGGEPLLNKPLLFKLVDYACGKAAAEGKRVEFTMTTNGTLLDDDVIALIRKHSFGLMISIDGGEAIQNSIRPYRSGEGSFDAVRRNVQRLLRSRKQVTARVTLSRATRDKVKVVEDLEAIGFTRIGMSAAKGTVEGRGLWDVTDEQIEDFDEQENDLTRRFLERVKRGQRPAYNPYARSLQDILQPRETQMRCGVGRGTTTVTEDEKLYPCHRYVGMANYVIGDVQTGVDREKLRRYYTEYYKTKLKCSRCWARRLCGGVCPSYTSRRDGTMQAPDEAYCNRIRRGFEDAADLLECVRTEHPDYYKELLAATVPGCGEED